jgi:branched-chain amino acid transport system substrate-binding protein
VDEVIFTTVRKEGMVMRRKVFLMIISLAVLLFLPHHAISQLKPGEPIVVGLPTFLGNFEGEESRKTATLAVEEINAKGGVSIKGVKHPLKIEASDIRDGAPGVPVPEALMGIEKIILEKKVHGIVVGPLRSEALLASMDLLAKYKVPFLGTIAMTPASEQKLLGDPEKYKYVFRVGINSPYFVSYLTGVMGFLGREFGFKKAFFMVQDVLWARGSASGMEAWFKKEGWEVLGMETFPTGASEYSSALMKVQQTGAQVIVPIFDMHESVILVKQWNAMKVPALMAGIIPPIAGPSAWKAFEGKIEGFVNTAMEAGHLGIKKIPKSAEFVEAYKKRWGVELEGQHGPAPSYDAVYVFADAVERAGTIEPDAVVAALQKTDWMGVDGRIRFGKSQQAIFGFDPRETALGCNFQWRQGKRLVVFPESIAEGKIELPAGLKPAK